MDLFDAATRDDREAEAPLPERMRPGRLDDVVGQDHLVGPDGVLRRMLRSGKLPSIILYGPPGTGKTTLAKLLASEVSAHFAEVHAVTSGVKDVREVIQAARDRRKYNGQATVLFIDEIHRFNKSQQDALLPAVEDGTVILIGATTENPLMEVNAPLLSRARVLTLSPLSDAAIRGLLDKALSDTEKGLGRLDVEVDPAAAAHLVDMANGDARVALGALEVAVLTASDSDDGAADDASRDAPPRRRVTLPEAEAALQRRAVVYDRTGDQHYDVVSAFIKSMRGSDPDAALYWLARMLKAGEDPRFVARRLLVHAAEDVGNADPQALVVAAAAAQSVEWVGMPEARIPLAQATIYIATAPKSNASIVAIERAFAAVDERRAEPVPPHLRDAHYRGAKQRLGHGVGYKYPHDFPGHYVEQQYLPEGLRDLKLYEPSESGYERELGERLSRLKRRRTAQGGPEGPAG